MSVCGIIFSNIHDHNIPELTRYRTIASVPFGCRYRFISHIRIHYGNLKNKFAGADGKDYLCARITSGQGENPDRR